MPSYRLSTEIAPYILWLPTYHNKILANDSAEKISLVAFLIKNSPKIFGIDMVSIWHETPPFHSQGTKSSCSQNTASNIRNIKDSERGLISFPSGRTCTPGHYALHISPGAPNICEGITDLQRHEGSGYTTRLEPSQTPAASMKNQIFRSFPPTVCLDRMLPSPILDMLSVTSVEGEDSDQIFRFSSDRSHWSLRDRTYTQQQLNWDEESVLIIASVLKDCLRNIEGSLLSSDLYENWLTLLDEESLMGKTSSIQR
ncbi:rho GTPase-activating protein 20-like [Mastomys coucha]|uniref:rho GTPase-activating protein 20-like n=1 Tax=Mastomys coucha TaxID=35658 RepID=UPI00126169EF|nr:rho GTPase-activating protein 20-like [Mastomys coucha]